MALPITYRIFGTGSFTTSDINVALPVVGDFAGIIQNVTHSLLAPNASAFAVTLNVTLPTNAHVVVSLETARVALHIDDSTIINAVVHSVVGNTFTVVVREFAAVLQNLKFRITVFI